MKTNFREALKEAWNDPITFGDLVFWFIFYLFIKIIVNL